MIKIDDLPDDVIWARGKYATVNGQYKDAMREMQYFTQQLCDTLRYLLQDEENQDKHMYRAKYLFDAIKPLVEETIELRPLKESLRVEAWGK